jgi:hypothetical protein
MRSLRRGKSIAVSFYPEFPKLLAPDIAAATVKSDSYLFAEQLLD